MKEKLLKVLKIQRTKLLNKECKTAEEFEAIQEKLNNIEIQIKEIMEG